MDLHKCAVCHKEFDFGETGLEGPGDIIVCRIECAKRSVKSRGDEYATRSLGIYRRYQCSVRKWIKRHIW